MNIFITVNGKKIEVDSKITLSELLKSLDIPKEGSAVAVDYVVVPQADWDNYCFKNEANIYIIRATQGG